MAWNIATKSDVQKLFPLDVDALKDEWSEWAEELLMDYVGVTDVADISTTTNFTEYLSGNGGRVLLTANPINTLSGVSIIGDGGTEESQALANYRAVGNELIALQSTTLPDEYEYFPEGYRNIKVEYVSIVPQQKIYNLSVVMMVIAMAQFEGRKGADADIEWGLAAQSGFGGTTANMQIGLISHLNAILDQVVGKKGRIKIR